MAGPISDRGFVPINGLDQWIEVHGANGDNPLLLFLHGGPGSAMSLLHQRFWRGWEADFTVIHWDQRGAGRTFARHGRRCGPLSIAGMTTDGIAVGEHLRARFPGRPLVVLGASWGSLLGWEMVRARPDLFDAYVGSGQVVDMARGEALSYEAALASAQAQDRRRDAARLASIGPPPYDSLRKLGQQRRLLVRGMPAAERKVFSQFVWEMVRRGGPWQALSAIRGGIYSILRLWKPLLGWRMADGGLALRAPVLILQGSEDMQTPSPLVAEVFPQIQAPEKALVWIEGAGHTAVCTHADRCLAEMRHFLAPRLGREAAA